MKTTIFVMLFGVMLSLSGCGLVPETTGWDNFDYSVVAPAKENSN